MQQRRHSLNLMLTMNNVRSNPHLIQVVDHGNCCGAKFASHLSQDRTVSYRCVTELQKFDSDISQVEFRTTSMSQRTIRDKYSQSNLTRLLHA